MESFSSVKITLLIHVYSQVDIYGMQSCGEVFQGSGISRRTSLGSYSGFVVKLDYLYRRSHEGDTLKLTCWYRPPNEENYIGMEATMNTRGKLLDSKIKLKYTPGLFITF